jgi:putative oxidoreductase
MFPLEADRFRGEIILIARILLVILFVISGWGKLTNYGWAVSYMATTGTPAPQIAAVLAIAIELFVGIAILLGIFTRPLALLMALFTLVAAFIGHRYWTMTGADQYSNEMHFYKNISIVGGFLLLYITGAGKYSLDAQLLPNPSGLNRAFGLNELVHHYGRSRMEVVDRLSRFASKFSERRRSDRPRSQQ